MRHRGTAATRRMAAGALVLACVPQCQGPDKDGLFGAPPDGWADAPTRGAGAETPADPRADVAVPVPPAGGGSAEQTPPLLGFGGAAAQETPPSMGVDGTMGSPDAGSVPEEPEEPEELEEPDAGAVPIADCVLGDFQAPEPLSGLEQGLNPGLNLNFWSPSLSVGGSTLFFAVSADGVDEQIASASRDGRGAAFGPAVLAAINAEGEDGTPLVSADGLSLYFFSTRQGGLGNRDVWRATRADGAADFAAPTLVAGINGPDLDHLPWVTPDELTMLWATDRSGGVGQLDIWIARRTARSDGFSNAAPLDGVNSVAHEGRAVLSNDELTVYFASERSGGVGGMDLWVAKRNDQADAFSQVTNLVGLNSPSLDQDPVLSSDEQELIFSSGRDGRIRLWRSVRDCD